MRKRVSLSKGARRGINRAKVYQLLKVHNFLTWDELLIKAKMSASMLSDALADLIPATVGVNRDSDDRIYFLKQPETRNVVRSRQLLSGLKL